MNEYINLGPDNIEEEHLCCAIGDPKHQAGVARKKEWLKDRFPDGHVFRKLNARGKTFIEYEPVETEEGDSTVTFTAERPFEDVVCFSIRRDTNLFHYMMIPADSVSTRSDSVYFGPAPKEESAYRGVRILLCNAHYLATLYPQLHQDFATTHAILYNDFYILTESYAAARAYLDDVTTGKVLASNQQYQFTKGNLPTGKGFELYYINNNNQFNQYLTRSFLKKKPGITNLKVFAFSFQKPVGNLLPTTVYLRFAEAQK